MQRSCEVCRSFRPEIVTRNPNPELVDVRLGTRVIVLCSAHAYIWRWSKVTTLDGFRELFKEPDGRRSLVERRGDDGDTDGSERRRDVGRRSSDRDRRRPN